MSDIRKTMLRTNCAVVMLAGGLVMFGASAALAGNVEMHFCAIGWLREFTHLDIGNGPLQPSHHNFEQGLQAMARAPDGKLYVAGDANVLYRLEPWPGRLTPVRSLEFPGGRSVRSMAVSPTNQLYITSHGGTGNLWAVLSKLDLETGELTHFGELHGYTGACQGLAFAPDGRLWGIIPRCDGTYCGYAVFLIENCVTTLIGFWGSPYDLSQSLEFTPNGRLFVMGNGHFCEANPVTGEPDFNTLREMAGDWRGLAWVPRLGNMNCDGLVNFEDINPFVLALTDLGAYQQQYPDCDYRHGDIDHNGAVDFGDINWFVELLAAE